MTTATAETALGTFVTPDLVATGVHFNAVGGDCLGKTELRRGLLEPAAVLVEFVPQPRIEGEFPQLACVFPVI